jgi:hypothetical protein
MCEGFQGAGVTGIHNFKQFDYSILYGLVMAVLDNAMNHASGLLRQLYSQLQLFIFLGYNFKFG